MQNNIDWNEIGARRRTAAAVGAAAGKKDLCAAQKTEM